MNTDTREVVDHFFRHQWGRVVSRLTGKFGIDLIDDVEDAVQEALAKAVQSWSFNGVPDNPAGWITRVAHNHLIDRLRRKQIFDGKASDIVDKSATSYHMNESMDEEVSDDVLRMMFACCHPSISAELQIILTLKILGGFSNTEVARQLLKKEDAIAKAYTRGKKKLVEEKIELQVPYGKYLNSRLNRVLRIVYLLFNEGYNVTTGESLIKSSLCEEAIRLAKLLLESKRLAKPEVHALLALMYFQSSRFEARVNHDNELVTLEQQDRSLWSQAHIEKGAEHLNLAAAFGQINDYYIQAGIAYCHCSSSSYENTNWSRILGLYDLQLQLNDSPVIFLNRSIVLGKVEGAQRALDELDAYPRKDALSKYHLWYAVRADLLAQLGRNKESIANYEQAIHLTTNKAEVNFMKEKQLLLGSH